MAITANACNTMRNFIEKISSIDVYIKLKPILLINIILKIYQAWSSCL